MAGMAYRLTATLSADALGEGVVARQDSHVAGGHDDTHVRFATIWQGESHGHVRVFEGCYAHWCGTSNIMVKKSRARPVFLPAHHHQLYRSSVPADVPYLLGFNLKSTCSDVSSTGAVCSTRPPPGASHMLGARLDRRPHYMPAYFVTTEHVDNICTSEYPRRSTFPCAKCQNATTAGQRWQSARIHRSAFCPQNFKRDGQAEQ